MKKLLPLGLLAALSNCMRSVAPAAAAAQAIALRLVRQDSSAGRRQWQLDKVEVQEELVSWQVYIPGTRNSKPSGALIRVDKRTGAPVRVPLR